MKKVLILQHIQCEGPGSLGDFLQKKSVSLDERRLADGDVLPDGLRGYSALISLGGPMNVDEEIKYPFLKQEKLLLKEAIQKDFPTLGVCLGAQMIARAAGASVKPGPKKEIGWYPLSLTPSGMSDPLFDEWTTPIHVFQWHGDTFEIPGNALHLASSSLFQNQAFRLGRRIYAFQFHVEITPDMIQDWIKTYEGEKLDAIKILKETQKYMPNLEKKAWEIYSRLWKIWEDERLLK